MNEKAMDPETAWMVKQDKDERELVKEQWSKKSSIKEIVEREEGEKIKNATLEYVYETVEKYLHVNDRNRIDLILAVALSNKMNGTPIWMFIVGNSGDWKSAFVRSLEGMSNVIKVDQITKNTLASGKKEANDLGKQLKDTSKILLFPDLAALTSMNNDDKNAIWGQFRNLYDGFIDKMTGSDVHRKYNNCHVTLIACTTHAIRDEILIHAQLGTRELMYDTNADMVDNDQKMDMAWMNEQCEYEMCQDISNVVQNFLTFKKIMDIEISSEIKEFLKHEANRLAILRASAMVDKTHKELINPVYPEIPTRLIKQFKRIYISLKSLDNNYPDEKAKEIISHIVDSSGNRVRQIIIDFMKHNNFNGNLDEKWLKIPEIQQGTRLGRKAIKAQLEMLWNMGLVEKEVREERIGGFVTYDYDLKAEVEKGGRIEEIAYYCLKE